jgi:uncharacterized LabA/DUF88 family protein
MHYNEPTTKRAIVFIDGQNLYHSVREAFGYTFPNYDIRKLSETICQRYSWNIEEVRFYTGVPDLQDDARWNNFWIRKLAAMGQIGIKIFSRSLRYRNQTVRLPNGKTHTFLVGQEKGIDVRIAIDVIRFAHERKYDVALIFSQDQDLTEVADEVRRIAIEQERWIKIASAFPVSPTKKDNRGINKTDWIKIDRQMYDACIDPNDYRNPTSNQTPYKSK